MPPLLCARRLYRRLKAPDVQSKPNVKSNPDVPIDEATGKRKKYIASACARKIFWYARVGSHPYMGGDALRIKRIVHFWAFAQYLMVQKDQILYTERS